MGSPGRKEKHRTLPNWKRTASTESQLVTVPEKAAAVDGTPDGLDNLLEDFHDAPRKGQAKATQSTLARQGSILPILGTNEKFTSNSSPRAIHPLDGQESSPFGNQRYSFHGFRKTEETDQNDLTVGQAASIKSKDGSVEPSGKPKGCKNFESVLKKQLSFSSPTSLKEPVTPKNFRGSQTPEVVLKSTNGGVEEKNLHLSCQLCKRFLGSNAEKCHCQNMSTPIPEDEKENIITKWKQVERDTPKRFQPDENQNQLIRDLSFDFKKRATNLERKHSGSEKDLLVTSGVDLSFVSPAKLQFLKPVRCTSADELWSPPRKNLKDNSMKHTKFDYMGADAQYFSANEIRHSSNTLESRMSEPVGAEKRKLVKMSLRQRLIHGNGEYIKYSEPEDCDKRDSTVNTTVNTTAESRLHLHEMKAKSKIRLRKRKGSNMKDTYSLAESCENGHKKRAPVRNRLSFLSRVLSHVRRSKSEDIMDHPESEGIYSDDAFLSPHPDMNSKCAAPVSRVLDEVKKMVCTLSLYAVLMP